MTEEAFIINQIDPSCWEIRENMGGAMHVSSFLAAGSEKAMLVDSGFGKGDLKAELEKLTGLPLILVNTHADGDHVLGNKPFGPAHMHPSEFDRYHQTVGYDAPVAALWEGDVIDLGGRSFRVVLIPGHTPGSIVLLDEANRVLFGGDSVQAGLIFMAGKGRNIAGYIASMKKLDAMCGKFDKVYAAHGEPVVGAGIIGGLIAGAEKVWNKEVEGVPGPAAFAELNAMVYTVGEVQFLY